MKLLYSLGLALLPFCALAQQKEKFRLFGTVDGMNEGKLLLESMEEEHPYKDSVQVKNGAFSFTGKTENGVFFVLRAEGQSSRLPFFLESGETRIAAKKDSLNSAVVTGSTFTAQWQEWGKQWRAIASQAGPLYKLLDSASNGGKEEVPPAIREKTDAGFADLTRQTKEAVMDFVKKYPESPVAPFIIMDRFINYPDPEAAAKTAAMLGEGAKNSFYGRQLTAIRATAEKTAIGASPEFSLPDTSGNLKSLASLKGKYVLVDFWASWCVPCRKENPNLVKAYKAYHDKGFEIIGVSLDHKKDPWLKAIQADQLTWKHVSDLKGWESALVKEYGIRSVPTSFLLDPDGKVIAKDLRGEALVEKLEALLD